MAYKLINKKFENVQKQFGFKVMIGNDLQRKTFVVQTTVRRAIR